MITFAPIENFTAIQGGIQADDNDEMTRTCYRFL
jgi:hypothetical protein